MLELRKIHRRLDNFHLGPLSLTVDPNDYYVLAGPSGAGKSQLLGVIAGINLPDGGTVWVDNQDITRLRLQERRIGIVFQDNALFPHLSVRGNISYPLHHRKSSSSEIRAETERLAGLTGILHLLHRMPATLSGGEARRAALARALASHPRILLLDEPLNGVDASLRPGLRQLFKQVNRQGIPVIHVTHDHEDAYALATKVGIIHQGKMIQQGTPEEVFMHPADAFVARFSGIRNYFKGKLLPGSDQGLANVALPGGFVIKVQENGREGEVHLMISASEVVISENAFDSSLRNRFMGKVTNITGTPGGIEVLTDCGFPVAALVSMEAVKELKLEAGKSVWVSFKASAVRVY